MIHLLDLCEKLNSVDTKNINMFGVSRGGMMTYETLREDRRIHKAVVVAGVADCTMNYEEREDMRSLLTELIRGDTGTIAGGIQQAFRGCMGR